MNKLWEFWILVYQRTLGGQEKPSRRRSRTSPPPPPSPLFLCRGEGAATRRLGKTQQKTRKRAGKKYGKPGSEPNPKLHDPFYDVIKRL